MPDKKIAEFDPLVLVDTTDMIPAETAAGANVKYTVGDLQLTADAAGGDLSGTYPNPTVVSFNSGTAFGTMAAEASNNVAITGGSITGLSSPSGSTDAATKGYVDSVAQGLSIRASVNLATAAVLPNTPSYNNGAGGVGATLTAGANAALVVDGVTVSSGNRVLVKTQASGLQNGIYSVTTVGDGATPWVLTRTTDADQSAELAAGTFTFVVAGATNASTGWVQTVAGTITVGTTATVWTQLSAAGAYSAGTGLGLAGTVFSLTTPVAVANGGTGTATPSLVAGANISISGSWPNQTIQASGGSSKTSTVAQGGTGRSTLTAHDVLVGNATSPVALVGPGTSGQPLLSGGASADPAYGTLSVGFGGTGDTTLTAHGVLVGNGTGAVAVTAAGTTGQPLVSGGASADPAFAVLGLSGGGTGAATLAAHGIVVGNGTSAVALVGPDASTTKVLTAAGASANPAFATAPGVLRISNFTTGTSVTYTPTAGTTALWVRATGGGGGGGGCASTSSTQLSFGTPATGAAMACKYITSGLTNLVYTVGALGTGGLAGANNGTDGTASTFAGDFGSTVTGTGGTKGLGGGAGTATGGPFFNKGSAGPAATGGDTNTHGEAGGIVFSTITNIAVVSTGAGGSPISPHGAPDQIGASSGAAGQVAGGYGTGGGPAINTQSQSARAGGNGSGGLIEIWDLRA